VDEKDNEGTDVIEDAADDASEAGDTEPTSEEETESETSEETEESEKETVKINAAEEKILGTLEKDYGIATFYVYQYKVNSVPENINNGFPTAQFSVGDWVTLKVDMNKFFAIDGINAGYNTSGWWYASLDNCELDGDTTEEKLNDFWAKLVSCMDEETQKLVENTTYRAYVVKKETQPPHMDGVTVVLPENPTPETAPDETETTVAAPNTTVETTPIATTPDTTVADTPNTVADTTTTVADTTTETTTTPEAPTTEIADADVPLAEAADVADTTVEIGDEDVPLAEGVELAEAEEEVEILDAATPLADAPSSEVPKTGDSVMLYVLFSMLSLAGILTLAVTGRKKAR
jgi:hypothetical protein